MFTQKYIRTRKSVCSRFHQPSHTQKVDIYTSILYFAYHHSKTQLEYDMNRIKFLFLIGLLLFVTGCSAKPITIKPLDYDYGLTSGRINGDCAVCISESDIKSKVVEGGIDKYEYSPYKALRFALGYGLKMSCNTVSFYDSKQAAIAGGEQVIFVPKIETQSSNSFPFWPPSEFKATLNTGIFDHEGSPVQNLTTIGEASTDNIDRRVSHGYAGSKALEQALSKLFENLDYDRINKRIHPGKTAANETGSSAKSPQKDNMTQVIKLYQGTFKFPAPIWVNQVRDLNSSKLYRRQDKNVFTLEQIPKDQDFKSWKQLHGVYGFYLPEYDMTRFTDESLNALALGCKTQARSTIIEQTDSKILMTFFCPDLAEPMVSVGCNTESGFLYISHVDDSFAKLYMAWRAPKEDVGCHPN